MKSRPALRLRRGAAATAVALVAWAALTPTAGAQTAPASVGDVGWWTRNPAARAPADGFAITRAPDGDVSVAALAITGSTTLARAVLLLRETGGLAAERATIKVCPTADAWKPGPAQAYSEAPTAECALGTAVANRNASVGVWAADVTSLVSALPGVGRVDLVIAPADDASMPLFDVQFARPELLAEAAPEPPPIEAYNPPPSSFTPPPDTSATTDEVAVDDPYASPVASIGADAIAPAVDPAPDAIAASATDATNTGEIAAVPTQALTGVDTGGGRSPVQALFFVAVATIAGVAAGTGRWFVRQRGGDLDLR